MALRHMTRNQAAYQALLQRYSKALIAEMAGVTRQYITKWDTVPLKFVPLISAKSGIPPEKILPDPYSNP